MRSQKRHFTFTFTQLMKYITEKIVACVAGVRRGDEHVKHEHVKHEHVKHEHVKHEHVKHEHVKISVGVPFLSLSTACHSG